jgi:hypothetical protein
MFLYKSATNKEKTTNPILVTKHGSHNQASHGRKGGGSGGGGGAGGAKPNKKDDNRYFASLTSEGKKGLKEIDAAAAGNDAGKLEEIENEYRMKAEDAEAAGDQEANSALSGVADHAASVRQEIKVVQPKSPKDKIQTSIRLRNSQQQALNRVNDIKNRMQGNNSASLQAKLSLELRDARNQLASIQTAQARLK